MEKEILEKIEYRIDLESNAIPVKEESSFWKYLDYSNWIPGEIEAEEEITKDFDLWNTKINKK